MTAWSERLETLYNASLPFIDVDIFMLPEKKFWGSILSPVFIHPSSSYLLNLSSETDVVGKKCSFRKGFVD